MDARLRAFSIARASAAHRRLKPMWARSPVKRG